MRSRAASATPDQWRDRALAAERGGNMPEARALMERGMAEHSRDASLANSAANFVMRAHDYGAAAALFGTAAALEPGSLEYALNHAIALNRLERFSDSLAVLGRFTESGKIVPRYCSTRGTAERGAGNLRAAGEWFERCLSVEPSHVRALHGRARLALERGEDGALDRFDRAIAVNQGEADLWLGRAQALDVAGRSDEARAIAQTLVEQAPHWSHGTRFLAQLRLAAGESDYDSHYAGAAAKVPQDPNIRADHAELLAGQDRFEEAADILAKARQDFPATHRFALLEAVHAGAAGNVERAETCFAACETQGTERWVQEARHRIRLGKYELAGELAARALDETPWDISAWALRGIVWRLLDDPRAAWLYGQDKGDITGDAGGFERAFQPEQGDMTGDAGGLVQYLPLDEGKAGLASAMPLLNRLHDGSPLPLGQSLRGGTQTRGILFARGEPELADLHGSLLKTLETYRANAPDLDPEHPLLRHRDTPWKLAGSWSVRLTGGGDFHTSHIHPQGIVSSALYCEIPPADKADPNAGSLEIGRPPPDLRLDLPPLRVIAPKPGHLALFPSFLHHGTRPFASGRRMSVAFDVIPKENSIP